MALAPGTRLGPYEIIAPLGSGGMGEVYRAADPRLKREVALKVLPASYASDTDRLRRFQQEAESAGGLNHPNIMVVFDIGTHDGAPYIVSELLEGESLREVIHGAPIPARRALDYAQQMANGLAAAHDRGIVHRDLKPDNIFITKDGRVKIFDFGLAKLAEPAAAGGLTAMPTLGGATEPGTLLGTMGYMSPEQVRAQDVDHRSDIFSFGAILYEMLSGRRAFHAPTAADTISAILREDPPQLSQTGASLPPGLERVVDHCLEKSPARRFQSARDLAFNLEAISSPSASALQVGPPPKRETPRIPAVVTLSLVLLTAVLAFLAGRRFEPIGSAAKPATRVGTVRQITEQSGRELFPGVSPDGSFIIYESDTGNRHDIYLQRTGGLKAINLTEGETPGWDWQPALSPDGQRIAFRSERDGGGVYVMGATGESVRNLNGNGYNPAWSPDGREVACGTEGVWMPYSRHGTSALFVLDSESGARRDVYAGDAVQPAWSPNGHRIAFWGLDAGSGRRDIWTLAAAGDTARPDTVRVTSDGAIDWNPVWSRDGEHLYFLSDRGGSMNIWRVALDEKTGRVRGPFEPVTVPVAECLGLSITAGGNLAYSAGLAATEVARAPFDASEARLKGPPISILSGSRFFVTLQVSPNGRSLVFWSQRLYDDIFVSDADGGNGHLLTDDPFRDRGPVWSTDGRRILFFSDRHGPYDILSMNTDGSDLRSITEGGKATDPHCLPDGNRLIINWKDSENAVLDPREGFPGGIVALPPPGDGQTFNVTSVSPDGKSLLGIMIRDAADVGLAVYRFGDSTYEIFKRSSEVNCSGVPVYLRDGRRILAREGKKLFVIDAATREERAILTLGQSEQFVACDIDPANEWVYWIKEKPVGDIWIAEAAR